MHQDPLLVKCMISHTICHFIHDDVIKWKHFPHDWPSLWGLHRSPVNSSHKGQWRRALIFSLLSVWTNGWVNNWYAGDLRCHCAHYDASVQDTDQTMDPQKTLHISLSQVSYGVSFVSIFGENNDIQRFKTMSMDRYSTMVLGKNKALS